MDLTPQDIIEFMKMWHDEFGEVLSHEQAEMEAKRLIDFFVTLAEVRLDRKNTE